MSKNKNRKNQHNQADKLSKGMSAIGKYSSKPKEEPPPQVRPRKETNNQEKRPDKKQGNFKPRRDKPNNHHQQNKQSDPNLGNIGWLFSKGYYIKLSRFLIAMKEAQKLKGDDKAKEIKKLEGEQKIDFDEKNDEIKNARLSNYKNQLQLLDQGFENAQTFSLTTIYPGLFTGGGQPHETGLLGEFKLGFFFDHTTGLPILPGSSVKGLLRSAFKHPAYIAGLLESQKVKLPEVPEKIPPFIKQLEKEIFDGENQDQNNQPTSQTPYQRDIFFDAIIDPDKSDQKGKFLSDDYITPHNDQFTDPIPLQFLKVLPNITFKFRFRLNTGTVTAGQKLDLFRAILLDLGIGAKTNTGYGHFAQSK